jgi:putative hydrolase of HD superfamily
MIIDDFNVYKLSNIIRYSQLNKIKHETVAEHSYYVSWFVNRLCTKYKVCDKIRLMALEAAILHDIPEVITNDITYDVKRMIPEVPALLQPYEEEAIKEHSERSYKVLFNPETKEEFIAKRIVKHADVLSVLQYCQNEEMLGNKNFTELRKATEERVKKSKAELLLVLKEEQDAEE